MHPLERYYTKAAHAACVALIVLTATPSQATSPLATTPLFLSVVVPPNLIVTLDDSGSMASAFVPELENCDDNRDRNNDGYLDDCADMNNTRWIKSAYGNPLYYNPAVIYPPAKNALGVDQTTTFAAAYRNGFDPSTATRNNLQTGYLPTATLALESNTTTEKFAQHFASDVRCSSSKCQIRTNTSTSTWLAPTSTTTNTAGPTCSNNTECRTKRTAAYYYTYLGTKTGCSGTVDQKRKNNSCYDIHIVNATSGPGTIDLNGDGTINATDKDERQNFANWYSFARTRNLTTATAASLAFSNLPTDVRVGWQGLNTCHNSDTNFVDSNCDGWKGDLGFTNAIRDFGSGASGTKKASFYTWLFQQPTADRTPLPTAMKRAGEYFKRTGDGNPYDNDFSSNGSSQTSCRRNYHILMTDGLWNNAETAGASDSASKPLPVIATEPDPDISSYSAITPYMDGTDNTLSDMAFNYWINDLTTLGNDVPANVADRTGTATARYWNPKNDPATWQHMVNFTIGLGLTQSLQAAGLTWNGDMYSGSYTQIKAGTTNWPAATSSAGAENAADLWHAAINSRGKFFSADNPTQMATAFRDALEAVTGNSGSATALSTNSTSIQPGNTVVYQAKFSPDWTGSLLALPVASNGTVGTELWDAGTRIPAHAARRIFTFNGTAGVEFKDTACTNSDFTVTQKLWLNYNTATSAPDAKCAERVNWIRGSHANEVQNGGVLRNRTTDGVMGDIINSDPAYVKNFDAGYASLPALANGLNTGNSSYGAYVAANAARMPMVYVGANDGKLYGIQADSTNAATSGVEQFAYVPRGVFGLDLSFLTYPLYTHKYFVDGAITVGDAFLGGSWKTILVAGLNSGGKSVYALDITDPSAFAAANVKWEFTDAELGYTYSQPQVGLLENGQWVAVFGNGYNSTGGANGGGGAYLYVVNLNTGLLIRRITVRDVATDENNGLSTPVLYDADNNGLIDTVYAGDLLGNMWKIDLSATASASWNVAFTGQPLMTALNASGQVQPITSQPKVTPHPLAGRMVVFGTGKYLNTTDVTNTQIQTYYGIRDNGSRVTSRSELQQQTIDYTSTAFGLSVRSTTETTVNYASKKGWYLDFPAGERVVSAPLIKVGRVIFVSITPSLDPCVPGGTSWLMELEAINGAGFPASILDLNGDGFFTADDVPPGGQVVSGVMTAGLGISKTPVWIEGFKIRTGTGGGFDTQRNKLCGGPGMPDCAIPTCEDTHTCPPVDPTGTVSRKYWIQIR